MSLVADVIGSRELLVNLTRREIKGKYKRTALGQLWSLANPVAQMLVYSLVFSFIIRMEPDPGDPSGLDVFAIWLMCALLPWSFFTGVVTGGMNSLVGNENLIKKVYFPRSTLVISSGLAALYTWAIEMLVLVVVLVLFGAEVLPWIPLTMLFMLVLFVFSVGVALLLSIANVYFRDMQHLVAILFQVWFYLTPIVYPIKEVARQSEAVGPLVGDVTLLDLYRLNPMERFAEVFRNLLYDNRLPAGDSVLWVCCWAVGAILLGGWVFGRHQRRLAEAL
ncbi:ABC transporter permease [Cellulomonas soli]|uniref:ABC transporter permease n=1 Tax=Cellulomonas soli TaxID=931535 RepID=UPI001D70D32A|nr:ABC transporter permease [Cellulomonadaceae bacterium]